MPENHTVVMLVNLTQYLPIDDLAVYEMRYQRRMILPRGRPPIYSLRGQRECWGRFGQL